VPNIRVVARLFAAACAVAALCANGAPASAAQSGQTTVQKPADKDAAKPAEKPSEKTEPKTPAKLPAQIETLETAVRFEANGDSRKEVHAHVKINDEIGTRQFARLNFNYNRAFESLEIPLARITHANGGTSDVLPSAITDNPDPVVANFPLYQDLRVKSVRILGLAPGDALEYRVVTTTTHHPLAPDFWFVHTFERSGVVAHEEMTVETPPARGYMHYNPQTPAQMSTSADGHLTWHWQRDEHAPVGQTADENVQPDVLVGSFETEGDFATKLAPLFYPETRADAAVRAKAEALTANLQNSEERLRAIYDFVAKDIRTVDLRVGATGFRPKNPAAVLQAGAATQEDKAELLIALFGSIENFTPTLCFTQQNDSSPPYYYALPANLEHALLALDERMFDKPLWLDPASEIAPFAMISRLYRGKTALCIAKSGDDPGPSGWEQVPDQLPFSASQKVNVQAVLHDTGTLTAGLKYTMRGDNELLLRTAFRQSPKEKWNGVAQLLELSDGFRGKITSTKTSDPYATKEPFTVDYELEQPKFIDWSKKTLRVPALLPLLGLPDPAAKPAAGAAPKPIELGTPLDVEVSATVHVPNGTGAEVPAGTSLQRDFATYESRYAVSNGMLTASRHINFILKEIPADRAAEYNAFLHTVQNDESQVFTLQAPDALAAKPPQTPASEPKKPQ
jgi:hypothetical protein